MTAQNYLKQHGISKETAELYGLTWDKNYLYIPIEDAEGEELFIKSRNLNYTKNSKEPKYKNSQGSTAVLFNIQAIKDADSVVVAEGEGDTIKLMQEGIVAVSSTGGAGTFPAQFAETLKDKKVWICLDNDEAGIKGTHKALEHIPHARVIQLPIGIKDVSDFYVAGNNTKDFLKLMKLALTHSEWKLSHIPKEHNIIDGTQLDKMKFKDTEWLIEGILPTEGFCFIYGAEGTGKSFLTLSMAKAVATGTPWLDTFHTNKTDILFLDMENPLSLTAKRMRGLGGTPENMHWLEYPSNFSLHDGKGGASEFALNVATIVKEKHIGLIIIDSFVDLMVGNSNSAEDTQIFFTALKQLFPNVCFAVLHHENKPSQGTYRNSAQRLRGSSNINAQAFTMFRLEAVAKSKTDMTLEQTKARDELKLDKFLIKMNVQDKEEGKGTIVTGFEYMGVVLPEEDQTDEAEEDITAAIAGSYGGSISRQELMRVVVTDGDISSATFNRVIRKMTDAKLVKKSKRGRAVWFDLSDPIVNDIDVEPSLF